MSILVVESNAAQVETIRDIVCNVLGTELTLVDSIDDALDALQTTTPELVLLPALVSPAEEAKLVTFLRAHPKGGHIDTLFTPVIGKQQPSTQSSTRGWLRWPTRRTESEAPSVEETAALFTERLTSSLHSARERRQLDEASSEVSNAVRDGVDEPDTPNEVVALIPDDGESALEGVPSDEATPNVAEPSVTPSPAPRDDRRTHRRFPAQELQELRASHVAGGPSVNVRDMSAGGALLESDAPLEYDFGVLVLSTGMLHTHYVPFRVVRQKVESHGSLTRFVEACAFLEPLDVSNLRGRDANTDAPPEDGVAALRAVLDPNLTEPASAERRRHVRVDGPFHGRRRGLLDMPVLIHNLSQGGCFVDSRLAVDPGHPLTLGLSTADGEWIDVAGEVVHNQPGIGFAVRFVELSDTIREGLARIIAERTAGDARKTTAT
jgi:hypothetical protein